MRKQEDRHQINQGNGDNSLGSILRGIFVLLALIALAVAAISALIHFVGPSVVNFFSSLSVLDSAVIVALITGTASTITFVVGRIVDGIMKRDEYLRAHREGPYMKLISLYYDFSMQKNAKETLSQEEVVRAFNAFTKELTLWGSAKAIKVWGEWRVKSTRGNIDPEGLLFGMEAVLIQLRKDMGQKHGIKKGDLLRLTVNDIDDII